MTTAFKILTLSVGSTSTKAAVFEGDKPLLRSNIHHDADELSAFDDPRDQQEYRTRAILDELSGKGFSIDGMDAFSGYCGGLKPAVGGTYLLNAQAVADATDGRTNHPAILAVPILFDFSKRTGKPAFAVNPPDTDELADVARICGYPGIYRESHVHCLNQKECAIRFAASLGKRYDEVNVIVAHVGGGLSVAAHQHGRMVDTTDVLRGEGPFSPNRSGDVPAKPVAALCFDGKHTKKEVDNVIGRTGGLKGLLGTDDAMEIERRIDSGDKWATLVYHAMAYQLAKQVGAFAAAMAGKVDGIVLTGGVSNDERFVEQVKQLTSWIAPVVAYGGDFEMEALAAGAVRVLSGSEEALTYTGETLFGGFPYEGAIAPIELGA
ncbi:MAG: butyrate kinase [Tractidigestivibacter sp.]|jgi:butyrate kinase|uniref:butyrate kinase n=1 Tax=Tractidigestivibacter sp. TaxID=2847320 RepID=UPI003D915209